MRAMRYEQVISEANQGRTVSDKDLQLFEQGDYLTEQLMENRRKSGILKHSNASETTQRSINKKVDVGRNTHLGFVA